MSNFTYGFHRAEHGISNDLGAGGGDEETNGLVFSGLLTKGISVDILEHLIESELSKALQSVTNEGWGPSLNKIEQVLITCLNQSTNVADSLRL